MLTKVILQANIDKVAKYFERADKIVIVTHVSPDGDALGSSLGLFHFLETQEKNVHVIVPNAFPDFLRWMPGAKDIIRYDKYAEFADQLIAEADVICCLDFNALSRIDEVAKPVAAAPGRKVLIDHHLNPEDFCRVTISHPEISSTSELIFRLICRMGNFEDITREGAECIYTGMMTDTGGFTYNSSRPEIFYIICQLLTKKLDKDKIYRNVFNNYSPWAIRLRGYIMNQKLNVLEDKHATYYSVSREEMAQYHFVRGDLEGLVNEPLRIKGIRMSISLKEDDRLDNRIWVSLRSVDNYSVEEVATRFFNGGGHLNASGGRIDGTLEDAERAARQAIDWFAEKYE